MTDHIGGSYLLSRKTPTQPTPQPTAKIPASLFLLGFFFSITRCNNIFNIIFLGTTSYDGHRINLKLTENSSQFIVDGNFLITWTAILIGKYKRSRACCYYRFLFNILLFLLSFLSKSNYTALNERLWMFLLL